MVPCDLFLIHHSKIVCDLFVVHHSNILRKMALIIAHEGNNRRENSSVCNHHSKIVQRHHIPVKQPAWRAKIARFQYPT